MMVANEQVPAVPDARAELCELLSDAASGTPPRRDMAGRYMLCRQALLTGMPRGTLPGFVAQCGSIFKFIEFITLYHWDVNERVALIEASFLGQRAPMAGAPQGVVGRRLDIFNDAAF